MYIAGIYTGDKSMQPLHVECGQGEQTVRWREDVTNLRV